MPQLEPYWKLPYLFNRSTRAAFEYIEKKNISDRLVFLHEDWLNFDKNYTLLADQIRSATAESGLFPIVCLAWNYYYADGIKSVLDYELGKENYFIILTDPKYNTDFNTGVWPQFLISMHMLNNHQLFRNKNYRIGYLTGGVRYHRLQLWEKIKDLATEEDVVVANLFGIKNYENTINYQTTSPEQAKQSADRWFKQLPWSNKPEYIDNIDQTELHPKNQWENDHCAYNAMINITGESTTDDQFMITEKTWKAYRSACLVINFGPTNVPDYLSKMGFGIWDEYDKNIDSVSKIKLIQELFCRDDITDIYHKHKNMIKHNENLVNSLDFIKKQTQSCVDKIEALL
jgi:hypothetical protein